jgi:hypothetical protein
MARIQPLPQVLATLTSTFTELVVPLVPNFAILWGLIYINLKVGVFSKYYYRSQADNMIVILLIERAP